MEIPPRQTLSSEFISRYSAIASARERRNQDWVNELVGAERDEYNRFIGSLLSPSGWTWKAPHTKNGLPSARLAWLPNGFQWVPWPGSGVRIAARTEHTEKLLDLLTENTRMTVEGFLPMIDEYVRQFVEFYRGADDQAFQHAFGEQHYLPLRKATVMFPNPDGIDLLPAVLWNEKAQKHLLDALRAYFPQTHWAIIVEAPRGDCVSFTIEPAWTTL